MSSHADWNTARRVLVWNERWKSRVGRELPPLLFHYAMFDYPSATTRSFGTQRGLPLASLYQCERLNCIVIIQAGIYDWGSRIAGIVRAKPILSELTAQSPPPLTPIFHQYSWSLIHRPMWIMSSCLDSEKHEPRKGEKQNGGGCPCESLGCEIYEVAKHIAMEINRGWVRGER